jgi:hypothetical protein
MISKRFKFTAADDKDRPTDCADTEGVVAYYYVHSVSQSRTF